MTRILPLILTSIAVLVLATACSGAPAAPSVASLVDPAASGAASASPSASALSPQDAALAYARCMREHGVDMPDPQVSTGKGGEVMINQSGGAPVPKDKMDKADTACRKFMAGAGPNGSSAQLSAEDMDKLLKFAKCMRAHGVDFPDPNADGGFVQVQVGDGSSGTVGTANSPDDPKFQAAQTACASLLPGKPDGNGGTTGGPSLSTSGPAVTGGGANPAPSAVSK